MYPLLEIKTVPVEIQIKTKNASLEYSRGTAEMEISRGDNGGLDIKSRPIKLNLDTFEPRSSALTPPVRSPEPITQNMPQNAQTVTATYSQQGQLMLNARLGQNMVADQGLTSTSSDIDWQNADIQIRYDMDKANTNWKIEKGEFKFTPGDIEITATPGETVIKYLGGPIYVPKSADPNYVDVKA